MKRIFKTEREVRPLEFINYELMQAKGGERILDITDFSQKDKYFNALKDEYFIKETKNKQGSYSLYLKINNSLAGKLQELEASEAWEKMNNKISSIF